MAAMSDHPRGRGDHDLHHRDPRHRLHAERADVEERRDVEQQRDHDDGATDPEQPGDERAAETQPDQRGRERGRHAARTGRGRARTRLTTGHTRMKTETARRIALTGRVTKILTSFAWATIDVRKYCSAIGPRMMPITSGGMGRSKRSMTKPGTPKGIADDKSARSVP